MRDLPFFSIIIPTYRRLACIARCLADIARLDYPPALFEVIIVDDGSDSPPETVVAPFADRFRVKLVSQPHGGPAAARNRGALLARGEYLAFTDDDCMPEPLWLKALAMRFSDSRQGAVGGRTTNQLAGNPYAEAGQLLVDYLVSYHNTDPDKARFSTSNNLSMPAEDFRAVDGFDKTFTFAGGEDREFCDRWRRGGRRMVYAPEVLVRHAHSLTCATFWRQHFNYGRGAFRFSLISRTNGSQAKGIEPLSFYFDLLKYPVASVRGVKVTLLTVLFAVSQAAHTAGYLHEWAHHTRRSKRETSVL